ncbi:hypothetical protein ABZ914_27960, partial [Spirillospora sp. NPDC046719]
VADLLDRLREVGAGEQVTVLADRAATHATLDNPYTVADLLDRLQEVGADEQVVLLADRAATHATLDDPYAVAFLLDRLREVGADQQVATLADRLPAAGMFGRFLEVADRMVQYQFGREPDGCPAGRWRWEDLE